MSRPVSLSRLQLGVGVLLFLGLLLVLLFAGDLSSSKFIYVDF